MTAEEVFSALYDKYGVDFNWHLLPLLQAKGMTIFCIIKKFGQWQSAIQMMMCCMLPEMNWGQTPIMFFI